MSMGRTTRGKHLATYCERRATTKSVVALAITLLIALTSVACGETIYVIPDDLEMESGSEDGETGTGDEDEDESGTGDGDGDGDGDGETGEPAETDTEGSDSGDGDGDGDGETGDGK